MTDRTSKERPLHAPTANWKNLRLRAELLRRLRRFFDDAQFIEVETPLLSADTVIDRYLDPISVTLPGDPRSPNDGQQMWLQTSPEFGMKRLMAAGGEAIYQVTRAFRTGEVGPLHNPEFTIVEWYRQGDDMAAAIDFLSQLADVLLGRGPAEQLSYQAAFERHVGVDPHTASIESLAQAAERRRIDVPQSFGSDRDDWLNLLLVECVEPHLGRVQPTILYDYPSSQAALAKIRPGTLPGTFPGDVAVAERFELYVDSIELANGYHELLDADELLERNRQANVARLADGRPALNEQSHMLDAMRAGLPPCSGVALGFDRVVMLAADAQSITQVIPFPIDRA